MWSSELGRGAGTPSALRVFVMRYGGDEGGNWEHALVVASVMPRGFAIYTREIDYFCPFNVDMMATKYPDFRGFVVIGRLKAGLSLEEAQTRADVFSKTLQQRNAERNRHWHVRLVPLADDAVGEFRPFMTAVAGAVAFVPLIIGTNVATLLLVRAAGRRKEIAVRSAVGASRWRLVRQLVTESTVLALVGAAGGLGLGYLLVRNMATQLPNRHTWGGSFLQAESIYVDGWVAAFAVVVALLTGVVFGVVPALQASAPDLTEALKDAGPGVIGGARRRGLANVLIIAQVMLAGVLVTGAALLVRSALALYSQGPGFASAERLVFQLRAQDAHLHGMLRSNGLSEEDAQKALTDSTEPYWSAKSVFREAAVQRIARLPGVLGATTTSATPMGGGYWLTPVARDANDGGGGGATTETLLTLVEPNYFQEMRIPILQGRSFNQDDGAHSEAVVVVSALIARRLWPGQNPIGKRLQSKRLKGEPWFTVVGVAGDTRDDGMDKPAVPHVYQPARQNQWWHGGERVIVRTGLEPQALMAVVRRAVGPDPAISIRRIYRLDDVVRDSAWRLNAATLLAAGLAALSLLLGVVGVYGVLSHAVRERTREFGLRIALGARRPQMVWLAVSNALATVGLGIAVGLTCAAGLTRYLQSLLFGIEPLDPASFAGATLALLTAAALASYLPARRAATVDPLTALRHD